MTTGAFSRRRALLRALACLSLVSTSRFSFGQTGKAEDAADKGKDGKGGKAGRGAALTVVVTGDDKPVPWAEVKLTSQLGSEMTHLTGPSGEALFSSVGTGASTVRVIATGWESVLQEVVLKHGPQRLPVKLKPLPK